MNNNIMMIISIVSILLVIIVVLIIKNKKKSNQQHQNKSKQSIVTSNKDKQNNINIIEKPQDTLISEKKKNKKTKKKNKQTAQHIQSKIKTQKEIEQTYAELFYGSINLKPQQNSMHGPVSIAYKNSKILVSTTKNELILYDLKKWKKQNPQSLQKYFTSLDNNIATAVCIGKNYYYAALNFDKTIIYYEFVGEKGEYFRECKKFPRNILKSDASSIYVSDEEKYIITSGSEADTTINIWSMRGQKIYSLNTYQIQHYDIKFSLSTIMVRGWTSQVKLFEIYNDKTDNFSKIQKTHHLTMQDQTISSSLDKLGFYGLTVSKTYQIILWDIKPKNSSKLQLKLVEPYQVQLDEINNCLIHTLKNDNERLKTLIVLSGNDKIVICDKYFNIHQSLLGVECKSMEIIGSVKNVVLITRSKAEKLYVWNLTKLLQEKFEQFSI